MPNFEQIIQEINMILHLIFGSHIPTWISPIIGWSLLIALILCALWGILLLISKIKEIWVQNFWPIFYDLEQKQRGLHRKFFAEHIESEIIRLGRQEEWKDYRYAELEAEVEAEGQRKVFYLLPFIEKTMSGLRHEKSLSKALASSQERLILVEGEPGSGKSIALRHVAQLMAARAKKSQSTSSIIPLYVNLKELERHNGEVIDRNLIEAFILESLKRIKDRDIDKFLDDEFKTGIRGGTWFFLFDSFDEIPEVLSSTEADSIIRDYGNAIEDFLHGMNRCRGIVASRLFRGPKYFRWPRFTILSLSDSRRIQLIRKANLKHNTESELIGHLDTASNEIQVMACNPLFLNLLCEHMKGGNPFPLNTHTVFESYINSRFSRDEMRIHRRFHIDHIQLRAAAEIVAFCMASDKGLGLSPTRENLKIALEEVNVISASDVDIILDALEFMKLARSESGRDGNHSNKFTFSHRRFQEYFATCLVLRKPDLVPPDQLLLDARWRETAVVMCQTQPMDVLAPIIGVANEIMEQVWNNVDDLINELTELVLNNRQNMIIEQQEFIYDSFPWPSGLYHLLSLIQEGFLGRVSALPELLRINVGKLVQTASRVGVLSDKRWALEIAGTAPEPILTELLSDAFTSNSYWLKEVAYRQTAHLSHITFDISQGIRNAILQLNAAGRLSRERHAIIAHLMRMHHADDYLAIVRLLLIAPKIDLYVHLTLCFAYIFIVMSTSAPLFIYLNILLFILFSWSMFNAMRFSYKGISDIGFVAFIRVMLIAFLILMGLLMSITVVKAIIVFVVVVICSYMLFFAPFSALSAKTGKFSQPRLWFLIPLLPLFYLINKPQYIKLLVLVIVRHRRTILLSFVIIPIVCLLIWGYVSLIMTNSIWAYIVSFLVLGLFLLPLIMMLRWSLIDSMQDKRKWKKWFGITREPLTFQEFCMATSFHSWEKTRSALRRIRYQHLLETTTEVEQLLKKLAFRIEVKQRISRAKKVDKSEKALSILPIVTSETIITPDFKEHNLLKWSDRPVILDEIYMLLEDVRRGLQDLPD